GGSTSSGTDSGYCSDNTPCGWCSTTLPKECTNESLIDNCSKCGCPPGLECQPDGTCIEKAADTGSNDVYVPTNDTIDTDNSINLNTELVGYWDFDGDTTDKSSHNNDGTLVGSAQWVPGKFGSALELDTTGEYVNCGSDDSLQLADDWTIGLWVKPSGGHTIGDGHRSILSGLFGGNSYCRFHTIGYLQFVLATTDGNTYITTGGKTTWEEKWYQATFVYDKSAGTLTKYVDGVQDGPVVENITGNTNIGATALTIPDRSSSLNGFIDEVSIWNRVLSQDEITALHDAPISDSIADSANGTQQNDTSNTPVIIDMTDNSAPTKINQAPVFNSIGNKSVEEGQLLQFTISATDPDGDALTYTALKLPSGASFDTQSRTFSWTPNYSQTGYFNVHFEVSDGKATDSENITVAVNEGSHYYVASNGNDNNPGTQQQPWRTITKAANTLRAGETVYVRAGTYYERVIPRNSGSPGDFITYSAYPGEKVTIDGSGYTLGIYGNGVFHIENKSYIKVVGFAIQNSQSAGIAAHNSCDHITISDNYITNCYSSGIWVGDTGRSSNIIVEDNEVYRCCTRVSQEGITLINVNIFEVYDNYVHDFPTVTSDGHPQVGIDAKAGCSNGSIHHNIVHDTRVGIYIDASTMATDNITIYNNLCYSNSENGFTVHGERGGDVSNIWTYNNISHSNKHHGFMINYEAHSYTNIYFINNSTYNNGGQTFSITASGSSINTLVVENNLFGSSSGQGILFEGYDASKHFFRNNHYQAGPYLGTSYTTGDPKYVNAPSNFLLQESSPCIDAGVTPSIAVNVDYQGASRPRGAGYDVGAYESW
ncbi:LamG-like jellyroll fold domain-containing protein, partial [Chloroflexota bacterium]